MAASMLLYVTCSIHQVIFSDSVWWQVHWVCHQGLQSSTWHHIHTRRWSGFGCRRFCSNLSPCVKAKTKHKSNKWRDKKISEINEMNCCLLFIESTAYMYMDCMITGHTSAIMDSNKLTIKRPLVFLESFIQYVTQLKTSPEIWGTRTGHIF